ncbi:MAG: hypothetical protein ACPLW5_00615 [Candidatus Bathyarchaeales archaeon]
MFLTGETEPIKLIYDKITETLNEKKKLSKAREEAIRKSKEIKKVLNYTLDVVDVLFNILRTLNGRVDWNKIETYVNSIADGVKTLESQIQKLPQTNLDLNALSSAVEERLPDKISQETINLLHTLQKYFEELISNEDDSIKELHPNFRDAKNILLAHYTLNDIILGVMIEDKEVAKENQEFTRILNDLAKSTKLKIEIGEIDRTLNKLPVESEKENIIMQLKSVFRQQLKELIALSP